MVKKFQIKINLHDILARIPNHLKECQSFKALHFTFSSRLFYLNQFKTFVPFRGDEIDWIEKKNFCYFILFIFVIYFFVILFSWLENWLRSNHLSNMQQQQQNANKIWKFERSFVTKVHLHIRERNWNNFVNRNF